MKRSMIAAAMSLVLLAACGGDDDNGTGPGGNSAFNQEFCVRGTAAVGQTKSGNVTASDCDAMDVADIQEEAYYEAYLVTVPSNRSVTFDLQSAFDNVLVIGEVTGLNTSTPSVTFFDGDDDREPGDTNALLTTGLEAGKTYVLMVAGWDYEETGNYTLQIR